jgi:holo-[acyl-carrier protein] synthase
MTIVGIGLDLVELYRVRRSLERWGDRLVRKLMDEDEASRLPADADGRARAVAAAIALKEAASKALGTGWSHGVAWRQVIADAGPPPAVRLTGRAAAVATHRGATGVAGAWLETRGDLVLAEVWLAR